MNWAAILAVVAGGGLGALARHAMAMRVTAWLGSAFPYGILAVNVTGGFLMGLLIGMMTTRWPVGETTRLLLTTGFLGGFTTFSTFSLDVVVLIEQKNIGAAALYIGMSVVVSIAALMAGLWIARHAGT